MNAKPLLVASTLSASLSFSPFGWAQPSASIALESASAALVRSGQSDWQPAQAPQPMHAGTWLRTRSEPARIRFSDGTKVLVGAGSLLQVQGATEVLADRGLKQTANRLEAREGDIEVHVPGTQPLLVVHTTEILGVLQRGRARLKVVPKGMLAMVDDGLARVASHGRWVTLTTGQHMSVGSPGAVPRPLPSAPQWLTSPCQVPPNNVCRIALASAYDRARVGAQWSPVPQATAFVVRIARDQHMQQPVGDTRMPAGVTRFASEPLEPGRYWIAVRAVNADGVEGPWAEPLAAHVVSLRPDPGVTLVPDEMVVVLPAGRAINVDQAQALEMSTLGLPWQPMSQALSLGTMEKRRKVRIRIKGQPHDEVVLTLERRMLHATVQLRPRNARWPDQPVEVSIRLLDPAGRVDLDRFEPDIRMLINSHVVHDVGAYLDRKGDRWEGQIEPWRGKGPWVVRVEVFDEGGNMLGRDFMEVAPGARSR